MTSLRKLDYDRTVAELASVDALLAKLTDEDVMVRLSLESRRNDLLAQIEQLGVFEGGTASAALFFGGRPVVGQKGIASEFAGNAVSKFQDLVSKLLIQEIGDLGQRGPVPNKAASTLHITSIVRGSFGFLLEEMQPQGELVDTALQHALDDAARLMSAFGNEDEEEFRSAAEEVDQRVLSTAGEFFSLMQDSGATLRLVSRDAEETFNPNAIAIAAARAQTTEIFEEPEEQQGQLAGVLPDGHMFELRLMSGDVIRGRVDRSIPVEVLTDWNVRMLFANTTARMIVRRVVRDGQIVRTTYKLTGLADPEVDGSVEQPA